MSPIFDADKSGADSEEARFLAKVVRRLDGSLAHLPQGIEGRLDSVRQAVMLQASEPQIPESVTMRLDEIRAAAMQRASAARQANGPWWRRWSPQGFAVPMSAFASLCVLVTTLAIFNLSGTPATMPLVVAENSLVLASEDEIELYENLEFYQWLADNGL